MASPQFHHCTHLDRMLCAAGGAGGCGASCSAMPVLGAESQAEGLVALCAAWSPVSAGGRQT